MVDNYIDRSIDQPDDHSPLIASVIVPVYNGCATIEACLNALADQTFAATLYELIVVDDGSTDATNATVTAWCRANPAVSCKLVHQSNRGPAAARNLGASVARGELLLFTDADCRPVADWIATFVAAFDRWPADATSTSTTASTSTSTTTSTMTSASTVEPVAAAMGTYRSEQRSIAARFAQLEFAERYLRMRQQTTVDVVATYSAAFRRSIFCAAGGFDPTFPKANNEDVEFSYRLSGMGHRMIFVPGAIVYHPHDDTWWSYARTKMTRAYWRTVVYKRYPGKAIKDSYTPQVLKLQILLAPLGLLGCCWFLFTRQLAGLVGLVPFLLTTLPMSRLALQQREWQLALLAPWGLWLRSIVFAIGVATALLPNNRVEQPTETILH